MNPDQERLVLDHMNLIGFVVGKFRNKGIPGNYFDELRDEAQLALVKAAANYDPDRGMKFKAYAITKMSYALTDYLRRPSTGLPMSLRYYKHFKETGEIKVSGVTKWGKRGHAYHARICRNYQRARRGTPRPRFNLDVAAFRRSFIANGVFL